jgi:hypothetical protein
MKLRRQFVSRWIILSVIAYPVAQILGYIAGLFVHGSFGFTMQDPGTQLSQAFTYGVYVAILGAVMGLVQWHTLRRISSVSAIWIPACSAGLLVSEAGAALVLAELGILRSTIGVFQAGPHLPEVLIFAVSGLWIGLFQWPLLRRSVPKASWWIVASCLAWGLATLVVANPNLFLLGGLTLGLVTVIALRLLFRLQDD